MWAVPRVILLLVYRVTMKATCVVAPFTFVPAADGAFEPTLATEALTTARLKLVTAASACQPSSDYPWPPINQYWTCVS